MGRCISGIDFYIRKRILKICVDLFTFTYAFQYRTLTQRMKYPNTTAVSVTVGDKK